ncbi:MAG: FadR/GntR family transcriptional regulator [Marivibrio sp.]|uniref:FadR/GntR family transcriptional regulator n=1 Tax=Marivibrio sp. TaxID=2039719 RepID=UPI0032EF3DF6
MDELSIGGEEEPARARATERESVSDRVAADVLRMVAAGDIAPGERLPSERRLAERLGVSRVSVRAALQRLKAQGFLAAVQGGGTRVVKTVSDADPALAELVRLDRSNLLDLMELRAQMEVWAARKAALEARADDLSALRRALEEMGSDAAPTPEAKARADVAFHMAVAKASHSVVYRHLLSVVRETLVEMLNYHRTELFATPEDDRAVMAHHTAIVEAIEGRDPDRAEAAMRRHLDWTRAHYEECDAR